MRSGLRGHVRRHLPPSVVVLVLLAFLDVAAIAVSLPVEGEVDESSQTLPVVGGIRGLLVGLGILSPRHFMVA